MLVEWLDEQTNLLMILKSNTSDIFKEFQRKSLYYKVCDMNFEL